MTPEQLERRRARHRERYANDPEWRARKLERKRSPKYRARERERQRARYAFDAKYRARPLRWPDMETWRKCGHERTKSNTTGACPSRPGGQCRICQRVRNRRYNESEKGRAQRRHYNESENRQAALQRYAQSEKGRASAQRWSQRYANDAEYRKRRLEQVAAWYRRTAGTPEGVARQMRKTHRRRAAQIEAHAEKRARERPSKGR
jgi:hypothetical protein